MALEVLGQLPASELLAAVGQLGLSVGDPSSRDQLIATLATSSYDSLTAVFSGYKRGRLKELCRALGLDDSGKEKTDLIARLLTASPSQQQLGLGLSAASSPAQEAKPKRGRPAGTQKEASKKTHITEPSPDELAKQVHEAQAAGKLTREQLERYLWAAADILRGSIDSSDYKSFIFGLLFLKRVGKHPHPLHGPAECAQEDAVSAGRAGRFRGRPCARNSPRVTHRRYPPQESTMDR